MKKCAGVACVHACSCTVQMKAAKLFIQATSFQPWPELILQPYHAQASALSNPQFYTSFVYSSSMPCRRGQCTTTSPRAQGHNCGRTGVVCTGCVVASMPRSSRERTSFLASASMALALSAHTLGVPLLSIVLVNVGAQN